MSTHLEAMNASVPQTVASKEDVTSYRKLRLAPFRIPICVSGLTPRKPPDEREESIER